MAQFYPMTEEVLSRIYAANFTAAEWRLWSYLVIFDPWGDHYEDLPDTFEIMQKVGIKKSTFYAAIAKFQEFNLFDFQSKSMSFRNLMGFTRIRKEFQNSGNDSEISENSPKNRKEFQEFGENSRTLENQQPEALSSKDSSSPQTIQTNTDLKQTFSEEEEAPPPPPPTEVLEVEIVEERNQPAGTSEGDQPTDASFVESEDGAYSTNAIALGEDQSTLPRNNTARTAKLREIEKLGATPQNFPWKQADGVSFREEMIDAVWQANRTWYSLPNGQKNKTAIAARLKALEKNLKKPDDSAIVAWNSLQAYWESAITLFPEAQQARQAFDEKEREAARQRRRNSTITFTA